MRVLCSAAFAVALVAFAAADALALPKCPSPGSCAELGCGVGPCRCKEIRPGNFECWSSNESEPGGPDS